MGSVAVTRVEPERRRPSTRRGALALAKRSKPGAYFLGSGSWGSGGYQGARSDRASLQEWTTRVGSADTDQLPDLPTLRARSRDLVRNAPLATGALNTVVTNVVGTGLRLQSSIDREVLGLSDEEADAWERRVERIWRLHARKLDIEGELGDAALQDLTFRSVLESGDLLMIRRFLERPGDLLGVRVQLVEADRISNPSGQMDEEGLQAGVEYDTNGITVGYWIGDRHPGDWFMGATDWERVAAVGPSGDRVARLLYRKLRPGQRRGVPYLAPVIEALKQLARYTDHELMATVVSSMLTLFVKSEGGEGAGLPQVLVGETDVPTKESQIFLGPGAVVDLNPDEEIDTVNPLRPNEAFDPFVTAVLRQIGVALELPYEVLVKHFERSYSAARAAFLEAWRFFRSRRSWLTENYCQPVYEWVITEAVARDLLDAPGFFDDPILRQAWLGSTWVGDAQGQIDPLKEINAAKGRVELGVSTRQEETAQLTGGDWETKHRQLAKEERMRREDGFGEMAAAEDDLVDDEEAVAA